MEENIKEEAKRFAEDLWEEKLKKSFNQKIENSYNDIINEFKNDLENYVISITNHFQELDKEFNDKWEEKFVNEFSKLGQLEKNQRNLNNNNNNININELNQIKNNNFINENEFNNIINNNNLENKNKENKIEKDENLRKKEINFNILKTPPLINITYLENMNPLINIILLCLSNIEYLVYYYLNSSKESKILHKSKEDSKNIYLNPSFLDYLDHFWKSNKKEFVPIEIHDILKKLMLENYNTNDPSIIVDYLLKKLDEELKINNKNNNIEDINPSERFNEHNIIKKYFNNFSNNRTHISDIFYSTIKIKKLCQNCKRQPLYYFESTPVINIYLEEKNNNNYLTFENDLKNILMKKEEYNIKENCIICSSEQTMNVIKDIYSFSVVLIININREKDPNNNILFKYPENFDGNKIINNKIIKMPNYELITIIKKVKNNNCNNFEYISYYKNFIDKCWYSYNNQKKEILNNDYKNFIFDDKNTCMLIYSKIK